MPKISVVTDKGEVLPVSEANYYDVGDAAGDIDGGDFWSYVREEHPGVKVKEIRIILDEPQEVGGDDEEDEEDDDDE